MIRCLGLSSSKSSTLVKTQIAGTVMSDGMEYGVPDNVLALAERDMLGIH